MIIDNIAQSSGKNGITPHIGANGNWWMDDVDTGVKAQGEGVAGVTPHIDEATGHWFIGEVDTGIKAKGTDGKDGTDGDDGTTPHIGANGNWFLGETDTGVAAQGKSDTRIETIMLPVADWDGDTLSQAITCTGVLEDETKQIITTVALPGNEEVCEACHIICSAFAKDTLTFTAAELPSVDVYIYVILENVSGGANASSDVYSTEETVVGTWIDGKPIYRLVFVTTLGSNITTSGTTNDIVDLTDKNIEECVILNGYWITAARSWMPFGMNNLSSTSLPNYVYMYLAEGKIIRERHDATGCNDRPCRIIIEYTKTTDTATIAIPSATALADAYDEGVNES